MKLTTIFIAIIMAFIPYGQTGTAPTRYGDSSYDGSSYQETIHETVSYSSRTIDEYTIPAGLPKYDDTSGKVNICAVLTATTCMGFYDRFYENLIPNFTPARIIKGKTIYYLGGVEVQQTLNDLYSAMGSSSTGTTLAGFKNGLQSYVNGKGYAVSYADVGSSYSGMQSFLQSEKPIAIFMNEHFNFIPLTSPTTENGTDTFYKELYNGYHVSLIFGFKTIRYFNSAGSLIETKNLIKVSTGHATAPQAYIELDSSVIVANSLCITVS